MCLYMCVQDCILDSPFTNICEVIIQKNKIEENTYRTVDELLTLQMSIQINNREVNNRERKRESRAYSNIYYKSFKKIKILLK